MNYTDLTRITLEQVLAFLRARRKMQGWGGAADASPVAWWSISH
jgi:hypothetical protein